MQRCSFVSGLIVFLLFASGLRGESIQTVVDAIRGPAISGQWFFAYANEDRGDTTTFNEFRLKRGYLTFKKNLSDRFSIRVTQDISVDKDGDGKGNIEIRLKYGYLLARLPDFGIISNPRLEVGVVHRPWIDFEQTVNRYRIQGNMFLERVDLASSADYGLTFMGLFGGRLDDETMEQVGSGHPGRFGSLAFGVYNGGGYDAVEANENKLIEGRLSIRPLPDQLPFLQLHGGLVSGAGNSADAPDLLLSAVALSWQHPLVTTMATMISSVGDKKGRMTDQAGEPLERTGWSLFAELTSPALSQLSLFGRIDQMEDDTVPDWAHRIMIAGVSWNIRPDVMLVLDWEKEERAGERREIVTELAVEFRF